MQFPVMEFKVISKNLITDREYTVRVSERSILLFKGTQLSPKYELLIKFTQTILWLQRHESLVGFAICFRLKQKNFYGNYTELIKYINLYQRFKEYLANLISFGQIQQFYTMRHVLGQGSSAKVLLGINIHTKQTVAIKILSKKSFKPLLLAALETEIRIMNKLRHQQHFVQLIEYYQSDTEFYLVLSLMNGKSLSNMILTQTIPPEAIKMIMQKLLEGVAIMHELGIIHRDLKPENLMFERPDDFNSLMICDFGLATLQKMDKYLFYKCGTPGYVAPEILNSYTKDLYGPACDLFSCGCILYKMVKGQNLFQAQTWNDLLKCNRQCEINLLDLSKSEEYVFLIIQQPLLCGLLTKNPALRMTARQALQLPYFSQQSCHSINDEQWDTHTFVNQIPLFLPTRDSSVSSMQGFVMKNYLSSYRNISRNLFYTPQVSPHRSKIDLH